MGEPRHLPDNPIFGNEDQEDYCQKIETFSKILFYIFYHDYAMAEQLGSDVPYDGIRQLRRHRLLPKRRYHFWKRWHTAQDVATIPIRLTTTPVNSSNLYGSPHEIQLARNRCFRILKWEPLGGDRCENLQKQLYSQPVWRSKRSGSEAFMWGANEYCIFTLIDTLRNNI